MADRHEVVIERVGAQGDGVAEIGGRPVFVPFTLVGERVAIEADGDRARLIDVIEASTDRIAPVCEHFGRCGGCSVQHMPPQLYRNWKRETVVSAFRARGLDVPVDELVQPGGLRRRAVMAARGGTLGFHEAASHAIVDIEECPILEPKIVALLPALRTLATNYRSKNDELKLTVTLTNAGLDVALDGAHRKSSLAQGTLLAEFARRHGLASLSIDGDVFFEALPPSLTFGATEALIPPGVFIQAVAEAEKEIAGRVGAAIGKSRSVVDLFCGAGAFTFPLAAKTRVAAYDGDRTAIDALSAAAKKSKGLKPIAAIVRDLFREPLSPLELNEHDAVIFDPPRAGAEAQAGKIARSKVKNVIAVSCNPATLARDARILVDGGYTISSVTPIDQFVYSPHVEVVAVFAR